MCIRDSYGIVSLSPGDGGPARSVPALAAATAAAGCQVVVCSQRAAEIDLTPYQDVEFVSGDIRAIAASMGPDIVHDNGIWLPCNHKAAQAAKTSGAKLVVSTRGMLEPWCLSHHRIRKTVAWYLYQSRDLKTAAALHATSPAEVATIRNLGFTQPALQLPNGVTPPDSIPTPLQRSSSKRLVFIGRIHPVKGLAHLLQAWNEVRPAGWTLDLFGPVENGHDREINELISTHKLQESVSLKGALSNNDKWVELSSASAFVLPSFTENFGIVVAEALLAGTPVLTTTGTPWQDMTKHGCGWWETPDVKGMSSGLKNLMACSDQALIEMGERGRQWMQEDFLWDRIGRNMLKSYEWLLTNDAQPDCIRTAE